MDEILAPPAPAQPAEAQPDATKEWTAPTLKKLDLTETGEWGGVDGDFITEGDFFDGSMP
jgi:hypothetical protein